MARLKLVGFDWYVFFLEDNYQDDLRKELSDNFAVVAEELGPDSIAIRGTDRAHFYGALFERYAMAERGVDGGFFPLPALMITDTSPRELEDDAKDAFAASVSILTPS